MPLETKSYPFSNVTAFRIDIQTTAKYFLHLGLQPPFTYSLPQIPAVELETKTKKQDSKHQPQTLKVQKKPPCISNQRMNVCLHA